MTELVQSVEGPLHHCCSYRSDMCNRTASASVCVPLGHQGTVRGGTLMTVQCSCYSTIPGREEFQCYYSQHCPTKSNSKQLLLSLAHVLNAGTCCNNLAEAMQGSGWEILCI